MTQRNRNRFLLALTLILGGGGLLAFGLFLLLGPPAWIRFDWSPGAALVWDGALSLLFFIQHSSMLRRTVRQRMEPYIEASFQDALFGVVSGGLLLLLVVFWQPVSGVMISLTGWGRFVARACYFVAVLGFMWTSSSLRHFDPLGVAALKADAEKSSPAPDQMILTISGPYRWVRHPFYFFSIVMIWSFPVLTADRLLFNLIWTLWIWVGTVLEERDLVRTFGEAYLDYQRSVPMLVPLTYFKRKEGNP